MKAKISFSKAVEGYLLAATARHLSFRLLTRTLVYVHSLQIQEMAKY